MVIENLLFTVGRAHPWARLPVAGSTLAQLAGARNKPRHHRH
jgi:hypothetical protein